MLFTVNNENILDDYFNMNNMPNMPRVLNPKEGLKLGNLYIDEYDQYKNYNPKSLQASNLRESQLLKIRELTFAVIDLNLKLDLEPNNRELYNLFKTYNEELNNLIMDYSNKYSPLELCYDTGNSYDWYKNPWPWEEEQNV